MHLSTNALDVAYTEEAKSIGFDSMIAVIDRDAVVAKECTIRVRAGGQLEWS